MSAAIKTYGLSRRFGDFVAVDGLDLKVPAGTVTAFLGPNGAGKTTTIRMLLGLLRPSAGRVDLFGTPLASSREALLARVGALVETPALYPHLSGRDNLELSRRRLGLATARLDQVLETVDLAANAGRAVGQYSLGMRQRLGLALALLAEPELLILDEPTNGLDPAGIREMRSLIRRFVDEQGMTVFLSSHLLAEVEQVCDRLAVVDHGRLAFQGSLDKFRAARRGEIVVDVDRPEEAVARLQTHGWQVVANESSIRIDASGREAAATVCRQLVEGGFGVHRLTEERASLEATFLDLTDGDREEGEP